MLELQTYVEGSDGAASLSFVAHSVLIENYSQSWAWIPSAQRFCPPLRTMTCELTSATDIAAVTWRNPPGNITPGPPGNPKGVLNAYWTDAPDHNSLPQPIYVGQTGASVIASAQSTSVAVPQGTIAFGLDTSIPSGLNTVTLIGNQSGTVYFNNTLLKNDGVIVLAADPSDTSLNFNATLGSTNLVAFPFTPPIAIQAGTLDLPIIVRTGGETIAASGIGQIIGGATSVDSTTVISIPANRTWRGSVGVSGQSSNAAATAPDVEVGANAVAPATGTMVAVVQIAQNAAGTTGADNSAVTPNVYVQAAGAGTTLVLKVHGASGATGWAIGVLIA